MLRLRPGCHHRCCGSCCPAGRVPAFARVGGPVCALDCRVSPACRVDRVFTRRMCPPFSCPLSPSGWSTSIAPLVGSCVPGGRSCLVVGCRCVRSLLASLLRSRTLSRSLPLSLCWSTDPWRHSRRRAPWRYRRSRLHQWPDRERGQDTTSHTGSSVSNGQSQRRAVASDQRRAHAESTERRADLRHDSGGAIRMSSRPADGVPSQPDDDDDEGEAGRIGPSLKSSPRVKDLATPTKPSQHMPNAGASRQEWQQIQRQTTADHLFIPLVHCLLRPSFSSFVFSASAPFET